MLRLANSLIYPRTRQTFGRWPSGGVRGEARHAPKHEKERGLPPQAKKARTKEEEKHSPPERAMPNTFGWSLFVGPSDSRRVRGRIAEVRCPVCNQRLATVAWAPLVKEPWATGRRRWPRAERRGGKQQNMRSYARAKGPEGFGSIGRGMDFGGRLGAEVGVRTLTKGAI